MQLSDEEMAEMLRNNIGLLEDDLEAVSLELAVDDSGEVLSLVLTHSSPLKKSASETVSLSKAGATEQVPLRIIQGHFPEEETATLDVEVMYEEAEASSSLGMSGTKVEEGGFWGTLCLSGDSISIIHEQGPCSQEDEFLFSNSHVFHHKGSKVHLRHTQIGVVTFVYNLDLNGKFTFDGGIAKTTENVPAANAFKVFHPDKEPLKIAGLMQVRTGMNVAKMGARTGWSEGRVKTPIITRVRGHTSLYPSWRGTYYSRSGDSGSPILHKTGDGKWYLVGIHFSSGPRFHSWDNAQVTAS